MELVCGTSKLEILKDRQVYVGSILVFLVSLSLVLYPLSSFAWALQVGGLIKAAINYSSVELIKSKLLAF